LESRKQISTGGSPELVALKKKQLVNDRIDAGNAKRGFQLRIHGGVVSNRRRNDRQSCADQRARRKSATLPGALVIQEEIACLSLFANGAAKAAAEDVLLHRRACLCGPI